MDEMEKERIDLKHHKYHLVLDQKRWLAPIGKNPQKVLDLGCGTGIWSIDFADANPSSEVLGVDLAPMQPTWTPPNCSFQLDDIERDWARQKQSFDFIFARDLLLCMRDWPQLVHQCFEHLKPGGWIEFQCVAGELYCDDGTLPADSHFRKYDRLLREAATAFGTPLEDPLRFKEWITAAGFEGVTETLSMIPTSPWPKEERLRQIGLWERENLVMGLEGISTRIFSRYGWSPAETQVFLTAVRKDIRNTAIHSYYNFHVVYGQKPLH